MNNLLMWQLSQSIMHLSLQLVLTAWYVLIIIHSLFTVLMLNKLKMVSNENPKKDWLEKDTNNTVSSSAKDKRKKAKPAKSLHCKIVSTINDNTVLKSMIRDGPPFLSVFPSSRGPDKYDSNEVSVFLCLSSVY